LRASRELKAVLQPISPYVTPLFSVNDSGKRKGVVIGGLLDAAFYFKRK